MYTHSLPQSRAKYSLFPTPIFFSCPFRAALSVFLSFVSKLRLFRCLFRSFFRRSGAKRLSACVCVCHTLSKSLKAQGRQARHIYLTQRSYAVSREVRADHSHVPAEFFTRCYPTLPLFDSMVAFMLLPTNPFSTADVQPR